MTDSHQLQEQAPPRGSALPQQAAPPKQRDAFFDNAKYLAIVLVAAGHAWEPLRGDSRTVTACYMALYALHMPAFILISGYLSRSFDGRPDRVQRLLTGVALPYVIFQIAYTYFQRWLQDDEDTYLPLFEPHWLMWFLLALLAWRLTVPLWKAVRHPVPLALALAAAATASPSIGNDLQLQRILQFLPYFVLGLVLRREHFQRVRTRAVRLAALPVFACAVLVAYRVLPRMKYTWFYHRESAQEMGEPWWTGIVLTLVMFACSLVLIACFFALVPGRHGWYTKLGAGTLYGYLLHGFLIKGARHWGWYDPEVMHHEPAALLITTVVAGLGMTLLCTPVVQRIFRPIVEPRLDWAFRREHAAR
ncbi:acyltransferase family protein [Streptomyces hoynatensis]|uniref:acyltransferase family protein n=1 Tax=Streptomyces hoynatensis TaxID=1141874 RepID=UPI0026C18889